MSSRNSRPSLDAPAAAGDEHPSRCYLLFAGSQPAPQGGLRDLVGTFSSEDTARRAFQQLRQSQSSASSWAQLAVVEGRHGLRPLSWFGIGAAPARTFPAFARPKRPHTRTEGGVMPVATRPSPPLPESEVEPIARRHGAKRMAIWLVGVVAVVAVAVGIVSDGSTRPAAPPPATVDGGNPSSSIVVPFSADGASVTDGISGVDG